MYDFWAITTSPKFRQRLLSEIGCKPVCFRSRWAPDLHKFAIGKKHFMGQSDAKFREAKKPKGKHNKVPGR